jgi:hypothetical protein
MATATTALMLPETAPTRAQEESVEAPGWSLDGARRKPSNVPAVTLDDHLRGVSRAPPARSVTTSAGAFQGPLWTALGNPPPRPLQGSQRPPGRPRDDPLGGGVGDPEIPRRVLHDPSDSSRRTSRRAPREPSTEASQPPARPSAATLHGGLTDDLDTLASTLRRESLRHLREPLRELRHHPPQKPRRPPHHPPPPPSSHAPQTTSPRSPSTLAEAPVHLGERLGDHRHPASRRSPIRLDKPRRDPDAGPRRPLAKLRHDRRGGLRGPSPYPDKGLRDPPQAPRQPLSGVLHGSGPRRPAGTPQRPALQRSTRPLLELRWMS